MPSFRAPSFMGGGKPGIKPPSFVSKAPPSKTTTPTVSSPVPDLAPAPAPDQITDSHIQALAKYLGYGPVSPETHVHRDLKKVLRRMSEDDPGVPIMELIANSGKARVQELFDSVSRAQVAPEPEKTFFGEPMSSPPDSTDPIAPEQQTGLDGTEEGFLSPGAVTTEDPVGTEEEVHDLPRIKDDPSRREEDEVEVVDEVDEGVDEGGEPEPEEEEESEFWPGGEYDPADEGESERLKRFQGSSEKVTKVSNWVGSNCAFASNSKRKITASRTSSGWNYDTLGSRKELLAAIPARRRTS